MAEATLPDWQRMRDLFEGAKRLDPAGQEAFLLEACGGDETLRRAVGRMLAGVEGPDAFLDTVLLPYVTSSGESQQTFANGELISNRFKVDRFIGRGGMGEVYAAQDRVTSTPVALKTIRKDIIFDSRIWQQFRKEVRLAQRVSHRNVCRIHDLFSCYRFGTPAAPPQIIQFLTMELLDGETLTEAIARQGCIGDRESCALVRQIAEGLSAVHRAEIMHRDLKPSNVILVSEGASRVRAVLTDFGLAQSVSLETTWLSSSSRSIGLGTPAYMSPEQLESGIVDAASDIYSLGVIWYEMVTGQNPHHSATFISTAMKRLSGKISPPRQANPELSPEVEKLILRCLERNPIKRPTADEIILQIDNQLSPELDGQRSTVEGLWPKNGWYRSVGLLAAAAGLPLALHSWMGRQTSPSDSFLTEPKQSTADFSEPLTTRFDFGAEQLAAEHTVPGEQAGSAATYQGVFANALRLENLDEHTESVSWFRKAKALRPFEPAPHFHLAALYIDSNRFEQAAFEISLLRKLGQEEWADWLACLSQFAAGTPESALQLGSRFEQSTDSNWRSFGYSIRAYWLGEMGRLPEAIRELNKGIAFDVTNDLLRSQIDKMIEVGWLYYRAGDKKACIDRCSKAYVLSPNPDQILDLGVISARAGDLRSAKIMLGELRHQHQTRLRRAGVLRLQGEILLALRKFEEANTAFSQATSLLPAMECREFLVRALARSGHTQQARAERSALMDHRSRFYARSQRSLPGLWATFVTETNHLVSKEPPSISTGRRRRMTKRSGLRSGSTPQQSLAG